MARRRRPVAEPDLPLAQRRLGLRRLRLPRSAPRARDARGPRRARGARRRARDPRAARPRPQPHQRPAPVVPRAPRLLRLARGPQRRSAQQLEEQLRRPGVDARRGQRRCGTCTTSRPSSPTSTGGTRRCAPSSTTSCASGWIAGSRASASTSPTGSSRTASCATTRRPTEDDTEHDRWLGQRLEYSMNRDEVHDVFRRWREVLRSVRRRARGRDVGARPRDASCATTATTSTSCTWPSTSSSCSPTSRRSSSRRSWPRPRRCCPSTRGRCGRWATTTWPASRRAGRTATPGSRAARSCCC